MSEDRTKMPEPLYEVKGFARAYLKYTGEEWWTSRNIATGNPADPWWRREDNPRLKEPEIIALAWQCVDADHAKVKAKGEKMARYFDYVVWTEYRRQQKPMGFFPLSVLTDHGRKVYDYLCHRKTGLVGRATDHRGMSADSFSLIWDFNPPLPKQVWVETTRTYRKVERKKPHHVSYTFTAADYMVIRDKLLDSGLVEEVELEIKPNVGVKFIIMR